jgi:hypothetical protein
MTALTRVELLWLEGQIERWIRFGAIVDEQLLDRRRRVLSFAPGSILAFVRWAGNEHGTIASRIDILRAVRPGEGYATVPFVQPGGELLLRQSGWPKVEAVLAAITQVETLGIAPESVCPDHWRQLHHRVAAGLPVLPYSQERHAAWLKRRRVAQ